MTNNSEKTEDTIFSSDTANSASLEPKPITFKDILTDEATLADLDRLGFEKPTLVQQLSIPAVLSGKDAIVQAKTGSGKTLAFAIPLIISLRETVKGKFTAAIILTPTRELALQVRDVISKLAPDFSATCIIGGASAAAQIKELRKDPRIVVGTPGRILDLIERRELILRRCSKFVLDEADEMLSMGFIDEIREILSRLPSKRQGLFFSATVTPRVQQLASSFLKDPVNLEAKVSEDRPPDIAHLYVNVDGSLTGKVSVLASLLEKENGASVIVFCQTKADTEFVELYLKRREFNVRRINSDLTQREREEIMSDFKEGRLQVMVATEVAARGIDIAGLDLVVNYSLPDQMESYVHRVGRTGRAGRSGRAISLIGPRDFGMFYGLRKGLPVTFNELKLDVEATGVASSEVSQSPRFLKGRR